MINITHSWCSRTIHKALSLELRSLIFIVTQRGRQVRCHWLLFSTRKPRLRGAPRGAQDPPTRRQSSGDSDHTLLSPGHELFKPEEAASALLTSEATGQVDPLPTCLQVPAPPASAASIHGREQRASSTSLSSSRQQEGHRDRPGKECSRWPEGSLWAQGQGTQDGPQTSPSHQPPRTKGKLGPRAPGSRAPEGLNLAWLLPTAWANFNPVSEPPNGDKDINITTYFQPQWRRVNKVLRARPP